MLSLANNNTYNFMFPCIKSLGSYKIFQDFLCLDSHLFGKMTYIPLLICLLVYML